MLRLWPGERLSGMCITPKTKFTPRNVRYSCRAEPAPLR